MWSFVCARVRACASSSSLRNTIFKNKLFMNFYVRYLGGIVTKYLLKWRRVTQRSSFQRFRIACRIAYFPRCERERERGKF